MEQAVQRGQGGLSLAQALTCWPMSKIATDGHMPTSGEYVVPRGKGWIHTGWSYGLASVDGVALSSRSALAYSPGQNICWWVQSWEQEVTTVSFTTGDCIYYGPTA
jgi:hypothetical protein